MSACMYGKLFIRDERPDKMQLFATFLKDFPAVFMLITLI